GRPPNIFWSPTSPTGGPSCVAGPPVGVTFIWIFSLKPSTTLTSRTSYQLGLLAATSALVDPQFTGALKATATFRYLFPGFGKSCEPWAPRVNWQLSGPVTLQKGRSDGLRTESGAKLM